MRILLGMSGGFDSTYAALLLKEAGHEVEGAVLVMHGYTELDAARESAQALGIPLHVVDCRELFNNTVIPNFIEEYGKGRTPNPCVICNSDVKFKALLDFARANGFDKIATGHYARIISRNSDGKIRHTLARATDSGKDQTYMLWRLSEDVLSSLVLPLADVKKSDARERAHEQSLVAADREESQEICFIPDGDYASFIEERVGASTEGSFVDSDGRVLGRHKGIIHYTVGQRKGLGIALGARAFVTEIRPDKNEVVLSFIPKSTEKVRVFKIHFSGIGEPRVGEEMRLTVKLRYLAPPVSCTVKYLGDGCAQLVLDTPARSVTPGQSAVFYDGDELVFGGLVDLVN